MLGWRVVFLGLSLLPERRCDFAIHVCRKAEVLALVVRIRSEFEPRTDERVIGIARVDQISPPLAPSNSSILSIVLRVMLHSWPS